METKATNKARLNLSAEVLELGKMVGMSKWAVVPGLGDILTGPCSPKMPSLPHLASPLLHFAKYVPSFLSGGVLGGFVINFHSDEPF